MDYKLFTISEDVERKEREVTTFLLSLAVDGYYVVFFHLFYTIHNTAITLKVYFFFLLVFSLTFALFNARCKHGPVISIKFWQVVYSECSKHYDKTVFHPYESRQILDFWRYDVPADDYPPL